MIEKTGEKDLTSATRTFNWVLSKLIKGIENNGEIVKAGIWQASSQFQDEIMYVKRNTQLVVPVGDIELNRIGADLNWAEAHFQERISGKPTNPGETYKYWPYAQFKDGNDPYQDGDVFSHTYQERFWPKHAGPKPIRKQIEKEPPKFEGYTPHKGIRYEYGDLDDVINQLKGNPLTRQAWLPIFFPEDTGAVHKQRVPCTLGYYFWVQGGKLHCNYVIRSCDVLRHFRNDIYLTSRLLQYIANCIDCKYGTMNFMCFNLHIFRNDLFALKKKELKLWTELVEKTSI